MSGFEMIPTNSEQVLNLPVDGRQALRVSNRLESANLTFLLTSVLVRDLSSVVFVLTGPMLNRFSALSKKILDIAEAERAPMIEPHGVTNDLRWKTVALISKSHERILAHRQLM